MANWMIKSCKLLTAIHQRLKTIQLQQTVMNADETPLKVIQEDKSRYYMRVYCTGGRFTAG